ncbi:MAG TPA: hypothetical protein VGI39_37260 [Polyangiaceae bacterium]|jgi:hypothetical protein
MEKNKKKIQVIHRGVKLDEQRSVEETQEERAGALRARTGVRAGLLRVGGVGCGGPGECLA